MSVAGPWEFRGWKQAGTLQFPQQAEVSRSADANALRIIRLATVANVIATTSAFHESLVPPSLSSLPQYASIALWLTITVAALFVRPQLVLRLSTDTCLILTFYGFAVLSVLWTDLSLPSLMKAVALFITSTGAYFLASRLSVEDIIDEMNKGLLVLAVASIFLVIFVPSIGVDEAWSHEGNWQGVFASKQALGITGAIFMFFSAYLYLIRGGRWRFLISFGAAAACAFGSESRGGGALALMACACVYVAGRSPRIAKMLAFAPLGLVFFASFLISHLYSTGADAFYVFGTKIDITERTYIWQFALAHFDERPIFGFGINGFWTTKELYLEYLRSHGWVLDNFHSGYVAILTETGLVGYTLFALCTFLFGLRIAASVDNQSMKRSRIVALIGFMVLIYMIDLTETIFLRSTSFIATLILVFLFNSSLPTLASERERMS